MTPLLDNMLCDNCAERAAALRITYRNRQPFKMCDKCTDKMKKELRAYRKTLHERGLLAPRMPKVEPLALH